MRWVGVVVLAVGCSGDLDLPDPPDLTPLNQLYNAPSLDFSVATAERVLERFVTRAAEIEELDELRPLTTELITFHDGVEPGEPSEPVRVRGVPLDVDAHVDVFINCPGVGGEIDEDAAALELVVRDSQLIPVVFGSVAGCGYSRDVAGVDVPIEVGGELAAFLPNLLDKSLPRVILVSFTLDAISLAGVSVPPRGGDFRLIGRRFELLVEVDQEGTAIAVREADGRIGVRAQNGEWLCSMETRSCERSADVSDSFVY